MSVNNNNGRETEMSRDRDFQIIRILLLLCFIMDESKHNKTMSINNNNEGQVRNAQGRRPQFSTTLVSVESADSLEYLSDNWTRKQKERL